MATIEEILADDAKLTALSNAIFDSVDTNHSGTIDKNELQIAMNQVADEGGFQRPSEQQVRDAMNQLDTDQSGTVDKNEFKVLVRQVLTALQHS